VDLDDLFAYVEAPRDALVRFTGDNQVPITWRSRGV
jgi:hypothetical protein